MVGLSTSECYWFDKESVLLLIINMWADEFAKSH